MGIRRTVSSLFAAPFGTLLEARVRELVEEALDRRHYPEPADIRALSRQLEHARTALTELRTQVEAAQERFEAVRTDLQTSGSDDTLRVLGAEGASADLTVRIEEVDERVRETAGRAASLAEAVRTAAERADAAAQVAAEAATSATASATKVEAAKAAAPEPEATEPEPAKPAKPKGDRGCLVPGCTNKHRARGFCGRHYQMWSRGTLPGFVTKDGQVFFEDDGPRFAVDPALAGRPAERDGDVIKVDGTAVEAAPVEG